MTWEPKNKTDDDDDAMVSDDEKDKDDMDPDKSRDHKGKTNLESSGPALALAYYSGGRPTVHSALHLIYRRGKFSHGKTNSARASWLAVFTLRLMFRQFFFPRSWPWVRAHFSQHNCINSIEP